jgi:hypothetical protein
MLHQVARRPNALVKTGQSVRLRQGMAADDVYLVEFG